MRKYYESHVTMEGDPVVVKPLVENLGWKFSKIDGDPILGKGVKCYATMHHSFAIPEGDVLDVLHITAAALRGNGVNVTREKIEVVIYDTKMK